MVCVINFREYLVKLRIKELRNILFVINFSEQQISMPIFRMNNQLDNQSDQSANK